MRSLTDHEKKFLFDLNHNPVFRDIIEQHVKPQKPGLPPYSVDKEGNDNRADWMSASLERDGFDRCLALLGVAND